MATEAPYFFTRTDPLQVYIDNNTSYFSQLKNSASRIVQKISLVAKATIAITKVELIKAITTGVAAGATIALAAKTNLIEIYPAVGWVLALESVTTFVAGTFLFLTAQSGLGLIEGRTEELDEGAKKIARAAGLGIGVGIAAIGIGIKTDILTGQVSAGMIITLIETLRAVKAARAVRVAGETGTSKTRQRTMIAASVASVVLGLAAKLGLGAVLATELEVKFVKEIAQVVIKKTGILATILALYGTAGLVCKIIEKSLKLRKKVDETIFFKAILRNHIQELPNGNIDTDDTNTKRGLLEAIINIYPENMNDMIKNLVKEIIRSEINITKENIPKFLHNHLSDFSDLQRKFKSLSEEEKRTFNYHKQSDYKESELHDQALRLMGKINYNDRKLQVEIYKSFKSAAEQLKKELEFN